MEIYCCTDFPKKQEQNIHMIAQVIFFRAFAAVSRIDWIEETASHFMFSRFSCLVEDSCESMQGHLHAHGYSMCEFSKKKCAAMVGCYTLDHGHNTWVCGGGGKWGGEVGKMTIDYLLPLSKPSTRQVANIVYLKKKCRIASLRLTSLDLWKS
jgi:hypothetical protein